MLIGVEALNDKHFEAMQKVLAKDFRGIDGRLMRPLVRLGLAEVKSAGVWAITKAGKKAMKE